jgi:Fe-S cluster assembly iron-binding protein IscA
MLHITPEAGLAIRKLVEAQGVTEGGGLRIETLEGKPDVELYVAPHADETDVVVTEQTTGAKVILDALTADYVDGKTLGVANTVESTARFELSGQGFSQD